MIGFDDSLSNNAGAFSNAIRRPDFAVGSQVLTNWRSRELTIRALYPHRPLLSAKVRTFVDFLVERLQGEPQWEKWRKR